jgi:hypothetical protein
LKKRKTKEGERKDRKKKNWESKRTEVRQRVKSR